MTPDEIRETRRARGWTQADLAKRVGCGQSTISMIEKGTRDAPLIMVEVERVLIQEEDRPAATTQAVHFVLPEFDRLTLPPKLPINVSRWQRPDYTGDFLYMQPLAGDAVLVAAVDIAGHGASAMPSGLYLHGWLRGWMHGQSAPPRLENLVIEMSRELRQTGIDATGFFAIISRHRSRPHTVTYEAITCGFPPPLLMTETPTATLDSTGTGPSLPVSDQEQLQPVRRDVSAPWRLVIATDGMLGRLGNRNEQDGLRKVRKWQSGGERDLPLESYLSTDSAVVDDELLAVLQWNGWDINMPFDVDSHSERHWAINMIEASTEHLSEERRSRLLQALVEGMSNVRRHAYGGQSGVLRVRFREEEKSYRVEILDEGTDKVTTAVTSKPKSGFSIMKAGADDFSVRRSHTGGTVVALVARKLISKTSGGEYAL